MSEKLPINQGVCGISIFASHEDLMGVLKITK